MGTYNSTLGEIKTYVDGALCNSNSSFAGETILYGSTDITVIGNINSGNSRPFEGMIDQVRILPYDLSPDQIAANYNAAAPRYNLIVANETSQ